MASTLTFTTEWSTSINDLLAVLSTSKSVAKHVIDCYTVGYYAGNERLLKFEFIEWFLYSGEERLTGAVNCDVEHIRQEIKSIMAIEDPTYDVGNRLEKLWEDIVILKPLIYNIEVATVLVAILSYFLLHSYFIINPWYIPPF
jgi:hypothetical protein